MKFVILKTYNDYKKIVQFPSTIQCKKYGTINVTLNHKFNTWYSLENIELKNVTPRIEKNDKHELTNQKYSKRKEQKKLKQFMIQEISPFSLLQIYREKHMTKICNLSSSGLAYMMLYAGPSNLVFDNAKGLLIYSCLHFTDNVTTNDNRFFGILRFCDRETENNHESGLFYINNQNQNFDVVMMIGQSDYKTLIEFNKPFISNILIIYFSKKEEATEVFDHLLKDAAFVDIILIDFLSRDWKIDLTLRPETRCSLENGYVVRATRFHHSVIK